MARANHRRPAALAAAIAVLAMTPAAAAETPAAASVREPDTKRALAILEYRAGSAALSQVGRRCAEILRDLTGLTVIDGDEARQRYGAKLDADLVKCRGQTDCVAAIGAALNVAEVLLIGVSEFGDVILTLARIDVKDANVTSRLADALAPDADPSRDDLTRYLRRVLPKSDFRRWGTIRIATDIAGVTVELGAKTRGVTPIEPLRVPAPATYAIALRKPGFSTFRAQVSVPPDAEIQVIPTMSRASTPWYKRWWVVTAVAGTVVAGVTISVLASSGGEGVPVVIRP